MPTSVVFEKMSSSSGFSAQRSTSSHCVDAASARLTDETIAEVARRVAVDEPLRRRA